MRVYNSPYDPANSYSFLNRPVNGPVTASLVGHGAFLLLILFGIPYIAKNPEVLYEPIPVAIVSASDLESEQKQPDAPPAEETPPPPLKKQAPQMVEETAPAPPDPEPVIEDAIPEPTPPPPPIETPESEVEEIEEAKPAPLPTRKPKPPPQKAKPKVEEKPKPKNAMAALLKNLEESDPSPTPVQTSDTSSNNTGISSGQLSFSEMDAVRAQVARCWNIRAGARYAEDLAVEIALIMNTDRSVRSAKIVDRSRYNRDPEFRAAADAALRAVRHPRCTPLDLPPAKYSEWKTLVLNFDPKDML